MLKIQTMTNMMTKMKTMITMRTTTKMNLNIKGLNGPSGIVVETFEV